MLKDMFNYIEVYENTSGQETWIYNKLDKNITQIDCNGEIVSIKFESFENKKQIYNDILKEYDILEETISKKLNKWFLEIFLED